MGAPQIQPDSPEIVEAVIKAVCTVVAGRTGVQFGQRQMNMVESRLKRRISELHLSGFAEYQQHLKANQAEENEALVSLLTTHHTYFFREFVQFEFLESSLPALVASAKARGSKTIEIWSAACSRGQEVYSLAMHLQQHLPQVAPGFGYKIYGSDVDKESVEIASNGVYKRQEIKEVPLAYLGQNWASGTGEIAEFVKAKKLIREHCSFGVQNLLALKGIEDKKFDVIFCRNVFIYFTAEQIKQITSSMLKHLQPGGIFLVGLSESLHGQGLPLKAVGPSVYAHQEAGPKQAAGAVTGIKADITSPGLNKPAGPRPGQAVVPIVAAAPAPLPNPLRVVCIDDSPTILALMKKILAKSEGFEVVGTALNGEEGKKAVEQLKPHLVTLDIHMPVCTGIEYLQKHHGPSKPPVVMVTSVSRDDAGLALKAITLGAADYVEKPALNNMEQRADELRAKLRTAFRNREKKSQVAAVDKEFARNLQIAQPEQCARVFVFTLSDMPKCVTAIKEAVAAKSPVFVGVEGADSILPEICDQLSKGSGAKVVPFVAGQKAPVSCGGLKAVMSQVAKEKYRAVSVMVFGEISVPGAKDIMTCAGAQIVLEDLGSGKGTAPLAGLAADTVPGTSFNYLADEHFAKGKKG